MYFVDACELVKYCYYNCKVAMKSVVQQFKFYLNNIIWASRLLAVLTIASRSREFGPSVTLLTMEPKVVLVEHLGRGC